MYLLELLEQLGAGEISGITIGGVSLVTIIGFAIRMVSLYCENRRAKMNKRDAIRKAAREILKCVREEIAKEENAKAKKNKEHAKKK